MDKLKTKWELYSVLMEAAKKAKELGLKEIFEAIIDVKLKVIELDSKDIGL